MQRCDGWNELTYSDHGEREKLSRAHVYPHHYRYILRSHTSLLLTIFVTLSTRSEKEYFWVRKCVSVTSQRAGNGSDGVMRPFYRLNSPSCTWSGRADGEYRAICSSILMKYLQIFLCSWQLRTFFSRAIVQQFAYVCHTQWDVIFELLSYVVCSRLERNLASCEPYLCS